VGEGNLIFLFKLNGAGEDRLLEGKSNPYNKQVRVRMRANSSEAGKGKRSISGKGRGI